MNSDVSVEQCCRTKLEPILSVRHAASCHIVRQDFGARVNRP
jgi:hypothetical protein